MCCKNNKTELGTKMTQSNVLTEARYNYTKIQKNIIYRMCEIIKKRWQTHSIDEQNVFQRTGYPMDLTYSDISPEDRNKNWTNLYNNLTELSKVHFSYENDNEWISGCFLTAKHNKKTNTFNIVISNVVLPMLIDLAEKYTEYYITVAMSLKSSYSQRFYELCSRWKNSKQQCFYYTIDELHELFCVPDTYKKRFASFKAKILDVAYKELNEKYKKNQIDLCFEYEIIKVGRSVKQIKFILVRKFTDQEKEKRNETKLDKRVIVRNFFMQNLTCKGEDTFLNDTLKELDRYPYLIELCFNKIYKITLQYPESTNNGGLIRHIYTQDIKPEIEKREKEEREARKVHQTTLEEAIEYEQKNPINQAVDTIINKTKTN